MAIFGTKPPMIGLVTCPTTVLVIGKTYLIENFITDDNFSNVCDTPILGTINTAGCIFEAVEAAPSTWTTSTIREVVLLDYSNVIKSDPSSKKISVESELAADRQFFPLGEYWEMSVVVNLWKYGNASAVKAKYAEIMLLLNTNIYLWRHWDGSAFAETSGGTKTLFYVDKITPSYLTTVAYEDILTIDFVSLTKVTQTVTA